MIRVLSGSGNKTKKTSLASIYFCLLKGQSLSAGYQHGDSCTIALGGAKHCSKSMVWYLHIRHKNKAARRMTEQGEKRRRHRATGRPLMLYWTGVSLPWQPAALNWYLEQQVELLQRIWCSVHIWCQLRWCYTPLLAPHHSPFTLTQALAVEPLALKCLTE